MADRVEQNRQLVRDYLAAWISGDAEKGSSYFDDDMECFLAGRHHLAGTYNGKKAVLEDYIAKVVELTDGRWSVVAVEDVMGSEERVTAVVLERFQLAGKEPLETYRIAIYKIRDGKIVGLWAYEHDQHAVDEYFS
jgi:ketosteroid isomerase-like protein